MNKLFTLKKFGFKISWNLILIGLNGNDEIMPLITRLDVVNYLESILVDNDEQTDNIINLICEKNDYTRFDELIKEYANNDNSSIDVQKRKWKVCLLKILIDNISEDWFQGMLELMEFWVSMGIQDDCPQAFPESDNNESIQDYFTLASYEVNLNKNREWMNKEIKSIICLEG